MNVVISKTYSKENDKYTLSEEKIIYRSNSRISTINEMNRIASGFIDSGIWNVSERSFMYNESLYVLTVERRKGDQDA